MKPSKDEIKEYVTELADYLQEHNLWKAIDVKMFQAIRTLIDQHFSAEGEVGELIKWTDEHIQEAKKRLRELSTKEEQFRTSLCDFDLFCRQLHSKNLDVLMQIKSLLSRPRTVTKGTDL